MLPYEELPRNIDRFITPVCQGTRLAISSVLFTMECRFQKPNGTEKTSSSNLRLSLFLITVVVVVVIVLVAGDVGGNMGLFLGCSLLTLFEFIELFWNFLRSRKSKDDDSVEDRENPEQNEARFS